MNYHEYVKNRKKIKNVKRPKLRNGFGSISYLGENRSRPFMLRGPATYNDQAVESRKIIGYTDNYYEGIEILIKYSKDNNCVEKERITFSEIYDLWREYETRRNDALSIEKKKKKPFASNYISVYNNQCETLYEIPIMSLTSSDIQKCIDSCEYEFATKKYIKLLCGKLLKYSKFLGLKVDTDLVKTLDIGSSTVSKIHKPFTQEEKERLWINLGNRHLDPYNIIDTVLMEIYMGVRPSELLELESSKITITNKVTVGGCKTKAGIDREIPLHDRIIPLVEARLEKGYKYLITDKNGLKLNYRHYLDIYKDLMKSLGMNHLPHDGRDTAATEMYNAGIKRLVYKLILGHAIQDITEKHYIEITLKQKLEAINTIK